MVLNSLRHIHLYKLFKNKELEHIYISVFLRNFGISLISVFIPIYLYNLGYEIYSILFFYFLWSLSFLIIAYPVSKAVSKIGVKHSMLASTPFLVIYLIGLNFIPEYKLLFFVLPFIYSIDSAFHWFGHHALFFIKSDKKDRGKEISIRSIFVLIAISIAPFIGGFIADETISFLFFIAGSLILVSSLPLFLSKDNYCINNFTWKSFRKTIFDKKERGDIISFGGYALETVIQWTVWPLFLIIVLETYSKTGVIIAGTTFMSFIGLYFSGFLSDKYDKIKLIRFWTILNSLGWFLRIFANSITKIAIVDSYKKTSQKFLHVPWESQTYDLMSKRDYYNFNIFRLCVFHIVRVFSLLLIMLIFYLDYKPFTITFIIAGIASLGYMFIDRN